MQIPSAGRQATNNVDKRCFTSVHCILANAPSTCFSGYIRQKHKPLRNYRSGRPNECDNIQATIEDHLREDFTAPAGNGGEYSWREVTRWVDGVTTVHTERHAYSGDGETDEQRGKVGRRCSILVVCQRHEEYQQHHRTVNLHAAISPNSITPTSAELNLGYIQHFDNSS